MDNSRISKIISNLCSIQLKSENSIKYRDDAVSLINFLENRVLSLERTLENVKTQITRTEAVLGDLKKYHKDLKNKKPKRCFLKFWR